MLKNDTDANEIIYLCSVKGEPSDQKGIAILSKTEFKTSNPTILSSEMFFRNEVYHKMRLEIENENKIICNLMYPATKEHIEKYSSEYRIVVSETKEIYETVTKPHFIDKMDHETKNRWIYNILEDKAELERRVFSND